LDRRATAPRALTEWLIVRNSEDGLLVCDLRNQHVTSLNAFATAVFKASDGEALPSVIAEKLRDCGFAEADHQSVEEALLKLSRAGLVIMPQAILPPRRHGLFGRFVQRLFAGGTAAAVSAAMLAPAVVTMVSPQSAYAFACTPTTCGPEEEEEGEEGGGEETGYPQTIEFTSTPPKNASVGGASYDVTATGGASSSPVVYST
jgi:hypothetical protein